MSSETATPGMPDAERRSTAVRNVTYALAAFLSLLGAIRYGLHAEAVVVVFVIAVLVVISRHDLERHIIPNRIVVPAWIATLLAQIVIAPHHWLEWIVASFGAGAFFLVIQLAYPAGLSYSGLSRPVSSPPACCSLRAPRHANVPSRSARFSPPRRS